MNELAEKITAEYKEKQAAYIEMAAEEFIYNRTEKNMPKKRALEKFNKQVEEYIKMQTDIYAIEMAAAGQPISPDTLEKMKRKILESATTKNSRIINITDVAAKKKARR